MWTWLLRTLKQQLASLVDKTLQRELHAARIELEKAVEAEKESQDLIKRKEEMIQGSQRELLSLRESLQGENEEYLFIAAQLSLKENQLNEAVMKWGALEQNLKNELAKKERKESELSSETTVFYKLHEVKNIVQYVERIMGKWGKTCPVFLDICEI